MTADRNSWKVLDYSLRDVGVPIHDAAIFLRDDVKSHILIHSGQEMSQAWRPWDHHHSHIEIMCNEPLKLASKYSGFVS